MHVAEMPKDSQTITVLVVDDDPDTVEEMQDIVDLEGWNSIIADDADRALEVLELYPYISVVVTDYHFKHPSSTIPDGLEMVKRAKELFPHLDLTFIVLSGDADQANAAKDAGAVAFLSKPLNADLLIEAIETGVSRGSNAPGDDAFAEEILEVVQSAAQELHVERTQNSGETE